jgi:hypothetical protein
MNEIFELKYNILQYVGHVNYAYRKFDISDEYFAMAEKLATMIYRPTDWQIAHVFNNQGDSLETKSGFIIDAAICEFGAALQDLEQKNGISVQQSLNIMDHIVAHYSIIEDSNLAIDEFRKKLLHSFGKDVCAAMMHMGIQLFESLDSFDTIVTSAINKFEDAYRICTEYIKYYKDTSISFTDCQLELCRSCMGIARCLQMIQRYTEAGVYYIRASKICTPLLNKLAPYMANIYNDPEMFKIFISGRCSVEEAFAQISTMQYVNYPYLTSIQRMHPTKWIFRCY